MALTDREIRKIEPRKALVKLSDGGGLQLWVMPDGAKRWRLAYRYNGNKRPSPSASTRQPASERRDDPSLVRKLDKSAKAKASANTFNSLADELLEKKSAEGKAERTFDKVEWLLSLARPDLGERPVSEIAAPEVLRVLKKVEARVGSKPQNGCGQPSVKCSALRSRPGGQIRTLRLLSAELSPRQRSSTGRPLLNPKPSVACSEPLLATRALQKRRPLWNFRP